MKHLLFQPFHKYIHTHQMTTCSFLGKNDYQSLVQIAQAGSNAGRSTDGKISLVKHSQIPLS